MAVGLTGDGVNTDQRVYFVVVRGRFIDKTASPPAGQPLPRGTVLTLVVDAGTHQLLDYSDGYAAPDISKLGRVGMLQLRWKRSAQSPAARSLE